MGDGDENLGFLTVVSYGTNVLDRFGYTPIARKAGFGGGLGEGLTVDAGTAS